MMKFSLFWINVRYMLDTGADIIRINRVVADDLEWSLLVCQTELFTRSLTRVLPQTVHRNAQPPIL